MTAMDVEAPILCAQATVIDARTVGESFIRIVVAGAELARWSAEVVDAGTVRDAYVKLIIPPPGGGGVVPDPAAIRDWLALPESERGWMRTYTVRRADTVVLDGAQVPALTIDMVVHPGDDEGPGSSWARSVAVGDELHIVGPGRGHAPWAARAPGQAGRIVCAGDETAAPALLAIAEELAAEPSSAREISIVIEVPTEADVRALSDGAPEFVTLVARTAVAGEEVIRRLAGILDVGEESIGSVMGGQRPAADRDREWHPASAVSDGDPYVFLAGESGLIKAMRRLTVDAAGIGKGSVAFMGYWRRGAAES